MLKFFDMLTNHSKIRLVREKETNMNKTDLVKEVSKKVKTSQRSAQNIIDALAETVEKTLAKGNKVTLVGFGTFEARKRAERTGRNPQTGAAIKIAAKVSPVFVPGKKFKEEVNK